MVIIIIIACDCHAMGAQGIKCDQTTGQCNCKKRVIGRTCDHCQDESYGLSGSGCKQCKCKEDGSFDQLCNKVNNVISLAAVLHDIS